MAHPDIGHLLCTRQDSNCNSEQSCLISRTQDGRFTHLPYFADEESKTKMLRNMLRVKRPINGTGPECLTPKSRGK